MKKYIKLIMEAEMSPMAAVPVEPQQALPQEPPVDTSNPEDVVKMDVPLLIRLLEYSREDANSDLDLHKLAERITSMCSNDTVLGMAQYDQLIAELAPPAEVPDASNNMTEGTARGGFGGSNGQANMEIDWIQKKIASLPPTKTKQIKDLQRQIRERELAIAFSKDNVKENNYPGIGAKPMSNYIPKIGDKIHAGLKVKGGAGFEGTVYKVDDTHAYFKNDEGRTFKAVFSGISCLAKNNNGITENDYDDDDTDNFNDGDRVRLKPDYAEGDEIFTVTQCDHNRQNCWIADDDGRGWRVNFGQIEMAEDDGGENDDMEPNDDEESSNYHRR